MPAITLRRAVAAAALTLVTSCSGPDGGPDDPPVPALALTSTTLALAEGGDDGTIGISLDHAPAAPVTVTITVAGDGIDATPATLQFTPADFATPKQVTVTALEDGDVLDGVDTLTFTGPGLTTRHAVVSSADDDIQALIFSDSTLTMAEATIDTFTVRLAFRPATDITFLVNRAQQSIIVFPATLTFTPANYDIPQEVQVLTARDGDVVPGVDTVYIAAIGDPHGGVPITIQDIDTMRILLDPPAAILDEGDSVTVLVSLSHRPIPALTVTLTPIDTVSVAATPAQLTFTADNFTTPVRVKLLARQDPDQNNTITPVRFTAPGVDTVQVGLRIIDDDQLSIIVDDDDHVLAVGDSVTVNVSLSAFTLAPTDSVIVTVQSQTPGIVSASPATVVFTAANHATPVPVRIKGLSSAGTIVGLIRLTAPNYDTATVVVDVD